MVERYAAGEGTGEEDAGKAFVSLNWLLSEEHLDLETELAWGFLDYLLLGTSAAPLRKALNDSGLGEALIGARPRLFRRTLSPLACPDPNPQPAERRLSMRRHVMLLVFMSSIADACLRWRSCPRCQYAGCEGILDMVWDMECDWEAHCGAMCCRWWPGR